MPEESAAQSVSEYYTWTFPGAPVRIQLHLDAVERLGREVRRAFEAIPSHSVEIGGLLLGTADFQASPVIEVKDFEPFLCEYRADHKFVLSDPDRRRLERRLAAGKSEHDGRLGVVGYYRSHIGEGLNLREEDVAIAKTCFYDPANVFLVVKPGSDGFSSAGFFFWDNGRMDSEFTFLEFPFDPRQLTGARVKPTRQGGVTAVDEGAPEPSVVTEFHADPEEETGEFQETRPSGNLRWIWNVLVAFLITSLGALGFLVYSRWPAPAPPPASDVPVLALQVERRGSDFRVSWNRSSNAVAQATEGVLTIRDGEAQQQDLHLDPDQLRNGSVLYSAANSAVQLRLEVTAPDGRKTVETVLALTAANAAKPVQVIPETPAPRVETKPAVKTPVAPRSFTPPAKERSFGEPLRVMMMDPPPPAATQQNLATMQPPGSSLPKLPAPTAVSRPPAARPAALEAVYTPARPLYQSQPVLPVGVRALINSLVEVDIKVQIDDRGRVIQAEALPVSSPTSTSLISAARNAAMQWVFEPARHGAQAMSSQMVL